MKLYSSLPSDLADWAQRQPLFLTATAGTHAAHINLSPKGSPETHFAVLSPTQCAYIDRTGSGCETIAHVYDNGRLCLMFMSFGQSPRILRLFCRATVVEYDDPRFEALVRRIGERGGRDAFEATRAVIVGDIWEVQTSCGYGVPRIKRGLYHGVEGGLDEEEEEGGLGAKEDKEKQARHARSALLDILRGTSRGRNKPDAPLDELCVFEARPTLDAYWDKRSHDKDIMRSYQRANCLSSRDGLPGLRASRRDAGERLWLRDARAWMARRAAERQSLAVGFVVATLLSLLLRWLGW
ncbi:hypothetical protein E4U21_002554 [Claviceps maximensis]|nr:hypothetical protein E4U21_002554 [Claviceps maximensis]